MYNISKCVPKSGQWVVLWEHRGVMFSATYRHNRGRLQCFIYNLDMWENREDIQKSLDPLYVQLKGECDE